MKEVGRSGPECPQGGGYSVLSCTGYYICVLCVQQTDSGFSDTKQCSHKEPGKCQVSPAGADLVPRGPPPLALQNRFVIIISNDFLIQWTIVKKYIAEVEM